jgi:hypothetical protein
MTRSGVREGGRSLRRGASPACAPTWRTPETSSNSLIETASCSETDSFAVSAGAVAFLALAALLFAEAIRGRGPRSVLDRGALGRAVRDDRQQHSRRLGTSTSTISSATPLPPMLVAIPADVPIVTLTSGAATFAADILTVDAAIRARPPTSTDETVWRRRRP